MLKSPDLVCRFMQAIRYLLLRTTVSNNQPLGSYMTHYGIKRIGISVTRWEIQIKMVSKGQFHHHFMSSFYASRAQKRKKTVNSCSFLRFWYLRAYKLLVNTLMKLTPVEECGWVKENSCYYNSITRWPILELNECTNPRRLTNMGVRYV